ncbi:MAG: four helix bundle suffix domain-containing protein [Verrucomicrobiae bacterium]
MGRIRPIFPLRNATVCLILQANPVNEPHKKLRPSGGYRKTASFQTTTIIYDATWWFCEKFLDARSRTVDQMVQAARSGRQNIAEGSRASATSSQTELRLVNVARASLDELLLDYEDYLRHRHLAQWDAGCPEASAVRAVPRAFRKDLTDPTDRSDLTDLSDADRWALYSRWLDSEDPGIRANTTICLIHQANFLLDRQIAALENAFVEEGGYSEQLATERLRRRRQDQSDPPDPSAPQPPQCPQCRSLMALRTAKSGKTPGSQFWGCTSYPECKGTAKI